MYSKINLVLFAVDQSPFALGQRFLMTEASSTEFCFELATAGDTQGTISDTTIASTDTTATATSGITVGAITAITQSMTAANVQIDVTEA